MWRFNVVVFALLGAAFYNLSGGADYAPRQESLQASGWTVLRTPEVTQTALADTQGAQTVSRASVNLDALPAAAPQRSPVMPLVTLAAVGDLPAVEPAVQTQPAPEVVLPGLTEMMAATNGTPAAATAETTAEDLRRIRPARVNMRNGPGTSYGVVDRLAQGTELRVLDSTGEWVKARVTDSGRIGWVAANLLVAAN